MKPREYRTTGGAFRRARKLGQRVLVRVIGHGVFLACPDGRAIPQDCTPDNYRLTLLGSR